MSDSRAIICGLGALLISSPFQRPCAAGDCNQNGIPDEEDLASIVLRFPSVADYATGAPVAALCVADLTGDGFPDAAVAHADTDEVTVLGNRSGSGRRFLEVDERYVVGARPTALVAADVNGDSHVDLVVAGGTTRAVFVLFNAGPGIFSPPVRYRLAGFRIVEALRTADLDGDGDLDLLVLFQAGSSVEILLNNGRGAFTSTPGLPALEEESIQDAAAEDIDRDGLADLVLTVRRLGGRDGAVLTYRSAGILDVAGFVVFVFEPLQRLDVAPVPGQVLVEDIDGDGLDDLVVSFPELEGRPGAPVRVFGRLPDGTFGEASDADGAADLVHIAAGDVDGDGDVDLAVQSGRRARVLLNDSSGGFPQTFDLPFDTFPRQLLLADADDDGVLDAWSLDPFFGEGVRVISTRSVPRSRDCDGNQRPDECDFPPGFDCALLGVSAACREDCNGNGLADPCEVLSGAASDCDSNGVPDSCDLMSGTLVDCDQNGLPDRCDAAHDCNRNGVADACDIASGRATDIDGDGIPDSCEAEGPAFQVSFAAPERLRPESFGAQMLFHTIGLAPGDPGAQGWGFYVRSSGCAMVGATTRGTAAGSVLDDPPGLRDQGFEITELTGYCAAHDFWGALTAVVLSFTTPVTLAPEDSPHAILRLRLEPAEPAPGACSTCELGLVEVDPYSDCPHRGQPLRNAVALNGVSVFDVGYTRRVIEICNPVFHRGDANGDGRLDISDAIRTFNFLFLGAPAPGCLEAADSNNDGRADLSDGIFSLNFLFGRGAQPAPPAPGPPSEPCGPDPESPEGFLGCEEYRAC
jgi:hypothetical protein